MQSKGIHDHHHRRRRRIDSIHQSILSLTWLAAMFGLGTVTVSIPPKRRAAASAAVSDVAAAAAILEENESRTPTSVRLWRHSVQRPLERENRGMRVRQRKPKRRKKKERLPINKTRCHHIRLTYRHHERVQSEIIPHFRFGNGPKQQDLYGPQTPFSVGRSMVILVIVCNCVFAGRGQRSASASRCG